MIYKVLVVDDSAFMRLELTKIIELDPRLKVVSTAADGSQVLQKIRRFLPDVVTLDINMPVLDGIEALKLIMKEVPLPVVMISALTREGAEETLDALNYGAFDFIHKPSGSISLDISIQGEIIRAKIKAAALYSRRKSRKSRTGKAFRGGTETTEESREVVKSIGGSRPVVQGNIVGIGVSTGGPRLLMSILPQIPAGFQGSILIAQHMPKAFTDSFARRLDKICQVRVKEARDGDIIETGGIYIAPGGTHTRVRIRNNRLLLIETSDDIPSKIFKPSIEVLFESLISSMGHRWLGVMLTGMGSDGARVLARHHKTGGHTIAESKESCLVYGMPRKVVELGGAEFVLKGNEIAGKIVELIGSSACH